jgi:hypothetical protein
VIAEVERWPGVTRHAHRFGGVEFRLGRRELGHLHARSRGASIADVPFPRGERDRLVGEGRARPHHVLPESGWVTASIADAADAENAVELFRLSYERAAAAAKRRG